MAPLQLRFRTPGGEIFEIDEVDDEETVEILLVRVMSLQPDLEDGIQISYNGNVFQDEAVIGSLGLQSGALLDVGVGKPSAPTQPEVPAAAPSVVDNLINMGFDRTKVVEALSAAFNDADRAVEYLFNGIPRSPETGHWGDAMFSSQLVSKSGLISTGEALRGASVVAVYFSAHWCPPCRNFTPPLARAFSAAPAELAVIFVSGDRDEASFSQYYGTMPWLAVPFSAVQRQSLGMSFGVKGIPSLVVLNAQGQVITTTGREDVTQCNFDLRECMRRWGVSAAPVAPVEPTPAPPVAQDTFPTPPALPIDDVVIDAAILRVTDEAWDVQEVFFATGLKVLENVLKNPDEVKFRQLKRKNPALCSKLLEVAGDAGVALLDEAGFKENGEFLALAGPADGRCTAVRDKLIAASTKAFEKHAREVRDERIKEELEKDKGRVTRYGGGEGGRMNLGRRGPARGGG